MTRNSISVRLLSLLVSAAVTASGCATTAASAGGVAPADPTAARLIADYAQKLPPGTLVRVDRATGRSVRGTLLQATHQQLVVQPRTRLPEPPVEIPVTEVVRLTEERRNGSSIGKAIAIGAGVGAGAALGFFLFILAALD